MTLLFIVVLIIAFVVAIKKKWIDRRIAMEGIIIGVVSGLIISSFTDVNFQARIIGPVKKLAKLRYMSKTWGDIKATQVDNGRVNVSATNIASGVTVTYKNTPLYKLPSDLAYAVSTGDIAQNKSIINILSPSIDSIQTKNEE